MAEDGRGAGARGLPRLDLGRGESLAQGSHKGRGVVLRRREGSSGSRSLELLLFLSGIGPIWCSAPGASGGRSRFGGGTEPMVWSDFELYQSPRRLYVKSCDVRLGFFKIRASGPRLAVAVAWHLDVGKRAPYMIPDDELMSVLGNAMADLDAGVPPTVADARFVWRWASAWGTAPSLDRCSACGRDMMSDLMSEDPASAPSTRLAEDGPLCAACAPPGGVRISRSAHMALYKAARVSRERLRAEGEAIAAMASSDEWARASEWLRGALRGI